MGPCSALMGVLFYPAFCPVLFVFFKNVWSYFLAVSELPTKTTFLVIIGLKMLDLYFYTFNSAFVCVIC